MEAYVISPAMYLLLLWAPGVTLTVHSSICPTTPPSPSGTKVMDATGASIWKFQISKTSACVTPKRIQESILALVASIVAFVVAFSIFTPAACRSPPIGMQLLKSMRAMYGPSLMKSSPRVAASMQRKACGDGAVGVN